MRQKLTGPRQKQIAACKGSRWMVLVAVALIPMSLWAQESADQESTGTVWQPKTYKFSRYQKMIAKAPFGRIPAKAPPPVVAEEPPSGEPQLAIAAVSVVEGKPVVYLIDLKTRVYQKINTEEENESKIRLVEISDESNPRDVVAKVLVNGRLTTMKYDIGILEAKPKLIAKRKGRVKNVAGNRVVQATRIAQKNATANPALVRNSGQAPGNGGPVQVTVSGVATSQNVYSVTPAAGGQAPVVRSIEDQRRLSTVPRRRVIVPGQSAPQQVTPTQP